MNFLRSLMVHPHMRGIELCNPQLATLYRKQIHRKPFLQRIYHEWYSRLASRIPVCEGEVLELGTGAGFLDDFIPGLITSETEFCQGITMVANAQRLPFAQASLRGIVMTDVLHHISQPRQFFAEATRCVRPGGVIAMIEPWVNPWSRLIYTHVHHEPFVPNDATWEPPEGTGAEHANGAIPWIIFHRDRETFLQEFPDWEICAITPLMPLAYLVSGGISMRSLMPGWSFRLWRMLERPLERYFGMFACIVLVRREDAGNIAASTPLG